MKDHAILDTRAPENKNLPFWIEDMPHYTFLEDSDERTNFFTKAMRDSYRHLDISSLNEEAYDQLGKNFDIWEGYNIKDTLNPEYTVFDDVFMHISFLSMDEFNKEQIRPVLFLKTDLYTGEASLVVVKGDYDINKVEMSKLIDIAEIRDEFDGPEDDLEEYLRDCAIRELREDPEYIWLEGLEVATITTDITLEAILRDDLRDKLLTNLFKNTPKSVLKDLNLPQKDVTYKDYLDALRKNALQDMEKGYLHRFYERKGANPENVINGLKHIIHKEERDMAIMRAMRENFENMESTLIQEWNDINGEVDAVVKRHDAKAAGQYYEVGIELPMDFAEEKGIDKNKVCDLLGLDGFALDVCQETVSGYGKLTGKPALFLITADFDEKKALEWAENTAKKVAAFDFADYCITHGGYDELKFDRPDPQRFMQAETYNIDTGEWNAEEKNVELEDEGIEDDLPFGQDNEEDGIDPGEDK